MRNMLMKKQIQVDNNDEHKQGEIIGKEKEMKRRHNIYMRIENILKGNGKSVEQENE